MVKFRFSALTRAALVAFAVAASFAQRGGSQAAADSAPRLSTRLEPFSSFHTFAATAIGWNFGIETGAFPQLTFTEALAKADSLNVADVEGSSEQELSREIPKKLNYNLKPGEVRAVRDALRAWNLRMPAYFTPTIGPDEDSGRKLFEFAKSIGVDTIVSYADPKLLPQLDRLANEFGINLALYDWNPATVLDRLNGFSNRIGAAGDLATAGDGFARLKDRLFVLNLREQDAHNLSALLSRMDELKLKPRLMTVDSGSLGQLDKALQPIIAARVDETSRNTPNLHIEPSMSASQREQMEAQEAKDLSRYGFTPAEIEQRIDAALPPQPRVKPAKPRKLLVIDLCVGYSGHIASRFWVNYALEAMAKKTGAYEVEFSNDLDHLKYERIRQYDAVYLNNTVGQLFPDQEVRDGLARFIHEGGGLGGNHGVPYASLDWKEFGDIIGTVHGVHRENTEKAMVHIDDPQSPLTRAFDGQEFLRTDEFFRFPTGPYSREKLHVLMSIDVANTDMNQGPPCSRPCFRPDNDYALSWIHTYGKGRVFYCALGHQPTLFADPKLADYFLAALQFILGDLGADTTPSARLAARN